jgi:DNA-3-methyladenine glycosylase
VRSGQAPPSEGRAPARKLGYVDFPWLSLPATRVDDAARQLLGHRLRAGGVTIRITEVEAYSGRGLDPASHAHRGRTARNEVMFGPAGFLYVYQIYGMHRCLNVVCGEEGVAAAVLLRAGEVIEGVDLARERRLGAKELASGPGKLTQALNLDMSAYGTSLIDGTGPATLLPPQGRAGRIAAGPRVGVTAAHDVAWRFWLEGEPSVSAYRRHTPKIRKTTAERPAGR